MQQFNVVAYCNPSLRIFIPHELTRARRFHPFQSVATLKIWADFAEPKRAWRAREYAIAAAIALLHAVLWMSLQSSRGAQSSEAARITLWLLPAPESTMQRRSQTPVQSPARVATPTPKSGARGAIRPLSIPVAIPPAVAEVADSAAGAGSANNQANAARPDVLGNALRNIGKIDQGLRKEFPSFPAPRPVSIQSRLEKAFALAAKHDGIVPAMEERQLPDGTRITRVTTSSGSYCVTQKGAGANDGIDRIANGNPFQVTSCGNLFN